MKKRTLSAVCIVAVAVGVLVCREGLQAQKLKGKTRPAPTKHLMRGILQANAGSLGAALKGAGPADDKAWEAAMTSAVLLNEASYLLMDDGRCPDAVWAGATKTLREGSAATIAALEKKDLEGAKAGSKTLMGACAACHTAHKPPKQ
jgi:cytochrome c556